MSLLRSADPLALHACFVRLQQLLDFRRSKPAAPSSCLLRVAAAADSSGCGEWLVPLAPGTYLSQSLVVAGFPFDGGLSWRHPASVSGDRSCCFSGELPRSPVVAGLRVRRGSEPSTLNSRLLRPAISMMSSADAVGFQQSGLGVGVFPFASGSLYLNSQG